jgi:hypothetical protein
MFILVLANQDFRQKYSNSNNIKDGEPSYVGV